MTEPSQYFKGRTVQEQMNEVIGYVDTRAAEVATTAIASDVAQVHQDMLDADADAQAAAASAAAAAGTLANAVKKTGEASQSIAGDIAVAGDLSAGGDLAVTGDAGVQGQLSVLGGCDLRAPVKIPVTPTNNDDAASKKYVDDSLNGYAQMIRTVNNQTKAGNLTMQESNITIFGSDTHKVNLKSRWMVSTQSGYSASMPQINFVASDDVILGRLYIRHNNGAFELMAMIYNHDGTTKSQVLLRGDN